MKICVGVVLYNPQIERLKQSLEVLVPIAEEVILVDNGSSNLKEIEDIYKKIENVVLLKNKENLGIATALNQICLFASTHQYDWVLTMDQDTVCPCDIIEKMSKYVDHGKVGILCPVVDYEGLNIPSKLSDGELTETYACMTSGSFTNVRAWREVGGFREDFFIDYVDNDFCKKLQLNNYKIFRVNDCVMHHQLGEAKIRRLFGIFRRAVCIHKPWRFYYMSRNYLLFIWEYKKHLNILKEYLKLASILWDGVLYADDKHSTIRYIGRGIKDAYKGVTGKLCS